MDASTLKQGPQYVRWASSAEVGPCDCCSDHPEGDAIGVAEFRFGWYVIHLCGTCLRRLKNQVRQAEG